MRSLDRERTLGWYAWTSRVHSRGRVYLRDYKQQSSGIGVVRVNLDCVPDLTSKSHDCVAGLFNLVCRARRLVDRHVSARTAEGQGQLGKYRHGRDGPGYDEVELLPQLRQAGKSPRHVRDALPGRSAAAYRSRASGTGLSCSWHPAACR